MATSLTYRNLREGYVHVCERVVQEGASVRPRGQLTHELTDVTIEVKDPSDVLPVGVGRKLNPAIAAAEALQLIGGVSDPQLMTRISSNFERFMDDGRFWGAYGDRVRIERRGMRMAHQAHLVVERLKADPDSRQALIVLWRPELDLDHSGMHDYPCTVMLMFLLREGKLQLHVTMRSNDVWWGLAYDAFQFTQLQLTVANALGVPFGSYFHHAVSLHAYERDFPAIGELRLPPAGGRPDLPIGVSCGGMEWIDAETDAKSMLSSVPTLSAQHPWWRETLEKYL